jgi:hypothetical protein
VVAGAAELIREPLNSAHKEAIKILTSGSTLGYVPAKDATLWAPLMDASKVRLVVDKNSLTLKDGKLFVDIVGENDGVAPCPLTRTLSRISKARSKQVRNLLFECE